jgi:hypothetical protein
MTFGYVLSFMGGFLACLGFVLVLSISRAARSPEARTP